MVLAMALRCVVAISAGANRRCEDATLPSGYQGEQVHIQLRIPGEHGVTIALAAAAAGCAANMSLQDIREALEALAPAKGTRRDQSWPSWEYAY